MLVVLKTGVIMFADVINSVGRALDEQTKGRRFDFHCGQTIFQLAWCGYTPRVKSAKKGLSYFIKFV